jgi:hypothetical protein
MVQSSRDYESVNGEITTPYSLLHVIIYSWTRLTSVLSMNAAISSSVVLASRLSDDVSVFALILFSVQLFALFPMLRHRIQARGTADGRWLIKS